MNWRAGWEGAFVIGIWLLSGLITFLLLKYWIIVSWWDIRIWEVVAAIGTWLLAGSIMFAFVHVEHMRRSTNAQLAVELFRELRKTEAIEKVRSIYNIPYDFSKPESVKNLRVNEEKDIDYVLDRLDMLGALVNKRVIDKSLAIEGFGGPAVLRCWYWLVHYIRDTQQNRGYYVENYEVFARASLEYFRDREVRISFRNDKLRVYVKDLVDELGKWDKDDSKKSLYPRNFKKIKMDRRNIAKEKLKRLRMLRRKTNQS